MNIIYRTILYNEYHMLCNTVYCIIYIVIYVMYKLQESEYYICTVNIVQYRMYYIESCNILYFVLYSPNFKEVNIILQYCIFYITVQTLRK